MPFFERSIIEITVQGKSASGQNVVNVFHYRRPDPASFEFQNSHLQEAVEDFNAIWIQRAIPLLHQDYSYQQIMGKALIGTIANPNPPPATVLDVGEQFVFAHTSPQQGARTGQVLPSYCAVGVQKLSSRAGRNFRGGFRLGTIREADKVGNEVEAGVYLPLVVTNMQAFVIAPLTVSFDSDPWEMCVFSRTLALAAPPPFTLLKDLTAKVTGAKVNPFMTSQVSRKQSLSSVT